MMSPTRLEDIFNAYVSTPLDAECYKKIAILLKQCTQSEREDFFEKYLPQELHLQLLKVFAANASGYYPAILHGLQEESKEVSKYCIDSKVLYSTPTSNIYDPEFLLPLLKTVSRSKRNRLIWNIGKYMPESIAADTLYDAVSKVWGTNIAFPLLIKASEELIQREICSGGTLSTLQLLTIAQRFPFVALTYLEKCPGKASLAGLKAARYIVRATIPKSFDYCQSQDNKKLLSKSANKIILQNYKQVVLDAPSKWAKLLNVRFVKHFLTADELGSFITKLFLQIERWYVPHTLLEYFKLLLPNQISQILQQTFQIRYGCPFVSKLEFWENNESLLCLLSVQERNAISESLDAKSKEIRWVPYMSCDKSIPRLKDALQSETNANVRASLVQNLLETVNINKDADKLEEVCQFVAVRYRNDREVLRAFFSYIPDLSSVSSKTWTIVYGLATKFYVSGDWYTECATKLFVACIKRDGKPGMLSYLERLMSGADYNLNVDSLKDLREDLRSQCINEVFTKDNVESTDQNTQYRLSQFLSLLSTWNAVMSPPIMNTNVQYFVQNTFKKKDSDENATSFILNKSNRMDVQFIEQCFQLSSVACFRFLRFLLLNHSSILNSNETAVKIANHLLERKLFSYVWLLKKLKKLGYVKLLQCLALHSKAAICDLQRTNCEHAIFLYSLTCANTSDYFSIIDPFLANTDDSESMLPPFKPEASENDITKETINVAKRRESIYKGIGFSFSHIDLPTATVDSLLKFCISGDLVLYVRDSLYSVCSSVPNAVAQTMLLSLMQRPVSVKKHALRIHRLVCDLQTQQEFLLHLIEVENHITTRTVLLQYAIDCLDNTKTASMWHVVSEMMKRLSPEDRSIILLLIDATVPEPYMEEYLRLLLEKSKLLKDVNIAFVSKILEIISWHTTVISEQFLESLIQEYFLSEAFDKSIGSHHSVSNLFLEYLKGVQLSTTLGRNLVTSDLTHRQEYLKARLHANTSGFTVDAINKEGIRVKEFSNGKLGDYPIRSMLVAFVESFCSQSLGQKSQNKTDLCLYVDILLEFLALFDQHLMFGPYVVISLTRIFKTNVLTEKNAQTAADTIGNCIGKFCDSTTLKSPELSRYILPGIVKRFFLQFFPETYNHVQNRILSEMLPSPPLDDGLSLLRLMVVADALPSEWRTNIKYESFRKSFIPLAKNTPVETFLFNQSD